MAICNGDHAVEPEKVRTDAAFDVRTGERVVIPLDWK